MMDYLEDEFGFIQELDDSLWWPELNLVQMSCRFDPASYSDDWPPRLEISLPASISNAVIKRKAEFLAGRYCAGEALMKLTGQAANIAVGELRNPVWPSGVCGSISHCGQLAVAAVTRDASIRGVGIDIATKAATGLVKEVDSYILVDEERSLFEGSEYSSEELFTLIFSIKESFFKAAFPSVGRYFNFDALTVVEVDSRKKIVRCRLNYALDNTLPNGKFFTGHFQILASLPLGGRGVATCMVIR